MNAKSRMTHEGERVVRKKNIVISNSIFLPNLAAAFQIPLATEQDGKLPTFLGPWLSPHHCGPIAIL